MLNDCISLGPVKCKKILMQRDGPKILQIQVSPGHDFKGRHGKSRLRNESISLKEVECVAGKGLRGDRFFDYKEDFKGQVTFFDQAVADDLQQRLGLSSLDFTSTRRNVLVAGIDLSKLIGKRFSIGEVAFIGVEECAPCYWMNEALGPGAEQMMRGRGGLRCRILSGGVLRVGDVEIAEW